MTGATTRPHRRSGPKPRFDPETRRARKNEQDYRRILVARDLMTWLEQNHPKIYAKAIAEIEANIASERGALPGGD